MKFSRLFILFLSFILFLFTITYASSIDITFSKQEIHPNEDIELTISLNLDDIEDNISIIYGQLDYDKNIFKVISEDDIQTLNDWDGLVFNTQNGMFIIDRNTLSKNSSEEILKIKLETNNIKNDTITTFQLINTKIIGSSKEEISLNDSKCTLNITPSLLDSLANKLLPYTGISTPIKYLILILSLITFVVLIVLFIYKKRKK